MSKWLGKGHPKRKGHMFLTLLPGPRAQRGWDTHLPLLGGWKCEPAGPKVALAPHLQPDLALGHCSASEPALQCLEWTQGPGKSGSHVWEWGTDQLGCAREITYVDWLLCRVELNLFLTPKVSGG